MGIGVELSLGVAKMMRPTHLASIRPSLYHSLHPSSPSSGLGCAYADTEPHRWAFTATVSAVGVHARNARQSTFGRVGIVVQSTALLTTKGRRRQRYILLQILTQELLLTCLIVRLVQPRWQADEGAVLILITTNLVGGGQVSML